MSQFLGECRPFTGCILLLLLMACSADDSQKTPVEAAVKTFGGSQNDSGKDIIPTSDGGFAILGHTQSQDGDVTDKENASFDYWLLKFDNENTLQWSKSYGGSKNDRGNHIQQTDGDGFVILGYSESSDGEVAENAGAQDFWVVKTDALGGIKWQKSFGFSGKDEGISMIRTNDSGFLLIGILDVTASAGQGNFGGKRHAGGDYWALKITSEGELQWSKYFGGTFTDTPYDVIETLDGSFIIVGSSDSSDVDISDNKGTYDFWVVKIANGGDLIWERNFGGGEIDEAHGIVSSPDGNYIIVGETRSNDGDVSFNHGAADVWVIKITGDGTLIWEKTYGGSSFEAARAITKSIKGGYLIAGSSRSIDGDPSVNQGQNDAWILKIGDDGQLEWEKTIGGSQIDLANSLTELADGSIIAIGESASGDMDVMQNKGFTDLMTIEIKK